NLPFSVHKPYLMKHHAPHDMEITNPNSMRNLLKIATQHSTSIVTPHSSERDPLAGTSPFNSVFIDAHRAFGNVSIHVDGMALPTEAQNELSH
ncbi:EspG domain-containing protein, partial [Enterobacter cloacae complex sp.6700816]